MVRVRLPRFLLLTLGLLATAAGQVGTAEAGVDRWTSLGPEGGVVWDLAASRPGDGVVLFAATSAGVFRSRDGAESWQRVLAPRSQGEDFHRLAVSTHDPRQVLAAAVGGGGVYRSGDGGETWTPVLQATAMQLVSHPADGTFHAWTLDGVGGDSLVLIWRSTDGGVTWEVYDGPHTSLVAPLAAHPTAADVFYSVDSRSLLISRDGGVSWQRLAAIPESLRAARCELAVDPADGDRLSALCGRSDAAPVVLRSEHGGVSVEVVASTGLATAQPSRLRLSGGGLILATGDSGVHRSSDQGESWEPVAAGLEAVSVTSLAVADDGSLWAGTLDGVSVVRPGETAWRSARRGLTAFDARAFVVDPTSGDLVVGGAGGSVLRRPGSGSAWEPLGDRLGEDGLGDRDVAALARTPSGYLAGSSATATSWRGLYRLVDGAAAWQKLSSQRVSGFAASPLRPGRIYAFGPHEMAVWSEDDGFRGLPSLSAIGNLFDLAASRRVPDLLFAAVGREMAVSRDGGESWLAEPLPGAFDEAFARWVIAPVDGDQERALAAGGDLFARNVFGWETAAAGRFDGCRPGPLASDPRRPGTVYAVSCRGVERSVDGGAGWGALGEGLADHLPIHQIVPDAVDPDRLYLATEEGVYVRRLAGAPALSLGDGRFEVRVAWRDPRARTGTGTPRPLTADTGAFWFFRPDNVELVVKVLDGRPVNGHWWVFFASLSNVEYEVTVTDTVTGEAATYVNPQGTFASRGDTRALPAASTAAASPAAPAAVVAPASAPLPATAPDALLLADRRFRVEVDWEDFAGDTGRGVPDPLTPDTGTFWFFNPDNVELVIKVLDGRPVNGHWWVFAGALTNVAYRLTVTDTLTGQSRVYDNPAGTFASFGDTTAFAAGP